MAAAGLSEEDARRHLEPVCQLHAIPTLLRIDEFQAYAAAVGLAVDVLEDLTPSMGLTRLPRPATPEWDAVFSNGPPPIQSLLTLGGAALAGAAHAGAVALCHWSALRS